MIMIREYLKKYIQKDIYIYIYIYPEEKLKNIDNLGINIIV